MRTEEEINRIAQYRLEKVQLFQVLVQGGSSRISAIRKMGMSSSTFWRWKTAYGNGGFEALKPAKSTGRPRTTAKEKLK